jgi:hypothetical protein
MHVYMYIFFFCNSYKKKLKKTIIALKIKYHKFKSIAHFVTQGQQAAAGIEHKMAREKVEHNELR